MNFDFATRPLTRLDLIAACGSRGPSSEQLQAQEMAARARATAEADLVRAQRELGESQNNASNVADLAAMAAADQKRRQRNRTLLAGLEYEEGTMLKPLEDPTSKSAKKAKRATLLGGV